MVRSARLEAHSRRSSFTTWFTFLVGVPAGVGLLYILEHGPWQNATIQRYVKHEAEQAVVVFFCCCLAAFLAKLLGALHERYAHSQQLLPNWDGKPMPVNEVTSLQQALALAGVQNTFLGRRVANILHFVSSRGSAADLDDQMRTLSDNDAIAVDGSYALTRFLIWAMPILGFLGTVLGITQAIAGIDVVKLEQGGAGDVTEGLTKAFDATALALALTLLAMFANSLCEKLETGLLERVDQYVDADLAHRFVRVPGAAGSAGTPALEQLIEKQVSLWSASMEKAEARWLQAAPQQEKLAGALQQALESALTRFGQRVVDIEKKLQERQQAVLDGLTKLAAALKDTSSGHQVAIAQLTDAIGQSVELVAKTQANEAQLLRLQESLAQNLALLANSATFEQAVESLTAAIHLLTTRVNPSAPALRVAA